jgi:hypothetical protein
MMREYETAAQHGAAALASELAQDDKEFNPSWSVEEAEKEYLASCSGFATFDL